MQLGAEKDVDERQAYFVEGGQLFGKFGYAKEQPRVHLGHAELAGETEPIDRSLFLGCVTLLMQRERLDHVLLDDTVFGLYARRNVGAQRAVLALDGAHFDLQSVRVGLTSARD